MRTYMLVCLGADSIIVSGKTRIRGLTTAAGLWVSACIGLSIGIGYLDVSSMICSVCGLEKLEDILKRPELREKGKYIISPSLPHTKE